MKVKFAQWDKVSKESITDKDMSSRRAETNRNLLWVVSPFWPAIFQLLDHHIGYYLSDLTAETELKKNSPKNRKDRWFNF
jgi:hypothetical protein